jgi:hypothetical protein
MNALCAAKGNAQVFVATYSRKITAAMGFA